MKPRLGHIQFLNCLPLYYGLVKKNILLDVELIKETPTQLNRLLLEDKLDISPISSIEYARNSKELLLLPDFTVSSDGEVQSIYLVSKVPLEELSKATIALTNTSATSQILLKVILQNYEIEPEFFVCPPELHQMLLEADAALLIGDPALRIKYFPPENLYLYDLGVEWKKITGKMMVFATCCVRKDYYDANPDLVNMVYQGIKSSVAYSRENLDEISASAAKWEKFSKEELKSYYQALKFDFEKAQIEGLLEFYKYAHEYGYLENVPELKFIETK